VGVFPGRSLAGWRITTTDKAAELARLEMATTIGEKLRLAREEGGISLRDISEQTRISMRYLEAIETDDYKRLPGGIFNKSFIKAYARYIGFDEKEAMESYQAMLRLKGESADEVVTAPKSLVYTDASSSRSPFVNLLLAILILGILSLGAYAALHWYQRRTAPRGSGPPNHGVQIVTRRIVTIPRRRDRINQPVIVAEARSRC
jgi:cytoskeletal protein RodZ